MPFEFIENIDSKYGVLGSLVVTVACFIYTFLLKFFQTKFDKRLGELEHKFQESMLTMNSYYAISQATLEKAYQKKIATYEQLLVCVNERARYINESPVNDVLESADERLSQLFSIKNLIEDNILYVTSNLASKYETWYQSALPFIKASNDSEYDAWENSFGTDQDREKAHSAGLDDLYRMMQETETEFQAILDCINQDICEIRASLERPTKQTV